MATKIFLDARTLDPSQTDRTVTVDLTDPFAEGGEAIVLDLGGGKLLKHFRPETDPFYQKSPDPAERDRNAAGAKRRLQIHQQKLPKFPKLPSKVVAPTALGRTKPGGLIIGYEMPRVQGNVLADYAMIDWREQNDIDNNRVWEIFLDWLDTFIALHAKDVIAGDVNNQNEIVTPDGKVYVIDADSMSFAGFPSETFTVRFVDPLICKPDELVMCRPHNKGSDMYAFANILWLTTLYVGPWEGTLPLKTKDLRVQGVRQKDRPLKRVSGMHPEVIWPKWATHWRCLPDEWLEYYDGLLHRDQRTDAAGFPRKLLTDHRWTKCTACGNYHARAHCPQCAAPTHPSIISATITKDIEIERIVDLAPAKILRAEVQGDKLLYLCHKDGEYQREFGPIGLSRPLDRDMQFALSDTRTMIGANGRAVRFTPGQRAQLVDAELYRDKTPVFCGNSRFFYWLRDGQIIRESASITGDYLDQMVKHQSLLWCGEEFGLAFYLVSGLQKAKVFDAEGPGPAVTVQHLPDLPGALLQTACYFSKTRAWLHATTEDGGVLRNHLMVIKPNGECSAHLSVEQGDPDCPWLNGFIHLGRTAARLKTASGQTLECLLAATDDGVVGLMEHQGSLKKVFGFEGTAGHVYQTDQLLYLDGLVRVRGSEIHRIRTKK